MRKVLAAVLGAIVGFPAGACVGTMLGMLWIIDLSAIMFTFFN
jgi:hypothetical protein